MSSRTLRPRSNRVLPSKVEQSKSNGQVVKSKDKARKNNDDNSDRDEPKTSKTRSSVAVSDKARTINDDNSDRREPKTSKTRSSVAVSDKSMAPIKRGTKRKLNDDDDDCQQLTKRTVQKVENISMHNEKKKKSTAKYEESDSEASVDEWDDCQRLTKRTVKKVENISKHNEKKKKSTVKYEESDSEASADEWEEMHEIDNDDDNDESTTISASATTDGVQITIGGKSKTDDAKKLERSIRLKLLRIEKSRCESMHKMHLLCYLAHLKYWSTMANDVDISAIALSLIPEGYLTAVQHSFSTTIAERFVKWFKSAFVIRNEKSLFEEAIDASKTKTAILHRLEQKIVANHFDSALILTILLRVLSLQTRLCISAQPLSLRPSNNLKSSDSTEKREKKGKNTEKLLRSTEKVMMTKRNYWCEYWQDDSEQWICIDPMHGIVDQPDSISTYADTPIHYAIAIDNDGGIRDLTARYSPSYLSLSIRRRRISADWWNIILSRFKPRNRKRDRLEDLLIHDMLMARPRPDNISEYKNHPLYVIERDILKVQAIYPKDTKPLGYFRNQAIYPRRTCYTLQCKESWIRKARIIKDGEEAYKVIKARPRMNVPKEKQVDRPLPLFGYWQTDQYIPKPAKDGKVPRNAFGNVEMYQPSMLPPGTVHLRLPGLLNVARKLNIDCAPAVVGWEWHQRINHPVCDGFVVCSEFADMLTAAWRKETETKRVEDIEKKQRRAIENWKRLLRGLMTLQRIRRKFGTNTSAKDKQYEQQELLDKSGDNDDATGIDDPNMAWPQNRCKFEMN